MTYGNYPSTRLRRNRRDEWSRQLVQENALSVSDLILPIFVIDGENKEEPVKSMPGVSRLSVDLVKKRVAEAKELGIPAIALFPVIPENLKSTNAWEALNPTNLICRAIKAIKAEIKDIGIIADVALDPYTPHGHDGVLKDGQVVNDETVTILAQYAAILAKAGADIVAPSDMMDGRVAAIRVALDKDNFQHVRILSYAAKYASSFYSPFREAVGSAASLGSADKKSYQMDIANSDEALREVALDIQEGADMVMIKPGLPYLDIISRIRAEFYIPVFAYQVSGEYAMLKAAADAGVLDYEKALLETLLAFKRAGASGIFTYAAIEAAKLIK